MKVAKYTFHSKSAGTYMNVLVLFAEVVPVLVLEASAALHGGEVARHVVDDVVAHVAAVLLRLSKEGGAAVVAVRTI